MKRDNINPEENYDEGGIKTRDFIEAKSLSYSLGNVVKYVIRHKKKNGLEDLKKALNYLEYAIDTYVEEEK